MRVRVCVCVCTQGERLTEAILRLDETLTLLCDATAIEKIEDAKCKGISNF